MKFKARTAIFSGLSLLISSIFVALSAEASAQGDDPLPSWNDGPAEQSISISGPRFCLCVHHTDAEREWACDRKSHAGKLDKGLDEAKARGWTVVSMKDDWKTIYP